MSVIDLTTAENNFSVAQNSYEKHIYNESYVEVFPWEGYASADDSISEKYSEFAVESFQEFLTSIKSEYLKEETELTGQVFTEIKESKKSDIKLNSIKIVGKFSDEYRGKINLITYVAYNFGFEFEQTTESQLTDTRVPTITTPSKPTYVKPTPRKSFNLNITSVPSGAIVKSGRKKLGKTPLQIYLKPGLHSLVVTKNGYQSSMDMVEVEGSKVVTSHIVLHELPAKVKKKGGNKLFILAGAAILGGGAYYFISQQEEKSQTGSVSLTIEIP